MKTLVSTAATGLALALSLVKLNLRLDTDISDEDDLLEHLIVVSTERAEHHLGRSLLTKTYTATASPAEKLMLVPNLVEITSITVTDDDDVETVLTVNDYRVRVTSAIPVVVLDEPTGSQVEIVYTAGYGAAADIPSAIRQWLLMDIATLYENREAIVTGMPVASIPHPFVDGLLDPYRVTY